MSRMFTVLVIIHRLVFLPSTHQLQSSQTQELYQLRKQLEFPKELDVWNNTKDLCYGFTFPAAVLTCEENSVTELKIIGDRLAKPSNFEGYPVIDHTLSQEFSVDSFVATLARLTSLKVVILVSLGIWGPLPSKIDRLSSLQVLDLSSNFLFGSIPPKLSTMTKLQSLTLDGNYFNDTVPNWLDSLSNLTLLSLKGNRLMGTLPASIGRLKTLTALSVSGNQLSGKIPDLAGLTSLDVLDISDNKLDSVLPVMPKGLVTVLLSRNLLRGEIPQQLGELRRLQHLDLSFNLLEGTPPEGLFSLPNITYLDLASNMISGSLPGSMTCCSQLGFVDISANRLSGGLPSCLSSNSSKRAVMFGGNCLTIDPGHQHDSKYCEVDHIEGKSYRMRNIGLMVVLVGGIIIMSLLVLLVLLALCRKNCQRPIGEQHLLPKPLPDNSASGFSSEVLASASKISISGVLSNSPF